MTPEYYNIAVAELGVQEIPGTASNSRVLEYQAAAGYNAHQDDVAWCGSFVSWCMKKAGVKYRFATGAQAADWANWGKACKEPFVGAVVVFAHHVGFFAGWVDKSKKSFKLLSGNSGGKNANGGEVRISTYANMNSVIAVRMPEKMSTPGVIKNPINLPQVKGAGAIVAGAATAIASNPSQVADGLEEAQNHFSSGTIISILAGIVILAGIGYIVWAAIHKNTQDKKFSAPPE